MNKHAVNIPPHIQKAIYAGDKDMLRRGALAATKARIRNNTIRTNQLQKHMNHPDTQHVMSWHDEDLRKISMNKESNVIGPIIGDTVEALANIIKGRQTTPPPVPNQQNQGQPTDGLIVNKQGAEGDLGSFGEALNKAHFNKAKEQNIEADKNLKVKSTPKATIAPSMKSRVFDHIVKHKTPYAVAAVGAGALGVNQLFKHLNNKQQPNVG